MHSSTHGFMVDLDASPHDVKISQTVTGLVDGQTYDLRFEAGAPFPNSAHLEVWFGGVKVGDISPTGQMQEYMITLTGGSGDHSNLLEFRETGTPDNQGTYLANVSVGDHRHRRDRRTSRRIRTRSLRIACSMRSLIRASIPTCRRNLRRERRRSSLWQPISAPTVRRQSGRSVYSLHDDERCGFRTDDDCGAADPSLQRDYGGVDFVVGRYDSDGVGGITSADNAAFAFTVDPTTGALSLVQYVSLHHPNTASNDEGIFLNTGSLSVTVTITDRRRRYGDAERRYLRQHPL